MVDSHSSPASINFGDADSALRSEFEEDILLEEEDAEVSNPSRKPGAAKPIPLGMMLGVGAVILLVVAGGFFLIFKKRPAVEQTQVVMDTPSQMAQVPQPVSIQPATQVPVPAPIKVPEQLASEVVSSKPIASGEVVVAPSVPAQVSVLPSSQVPTNPQETQTDQKALVPKDVATTSDLKALVLKLDQMQATVSSLQYQLNELKKTQGTHPVTEKVTQKVTTTNAAPKEVKPVAKPVAKPTVKPTKETKVVNIPAANDSKAATASAELKPEVKGNGYVSAMIGNRAWVVRRNADGSEAEQSVTLGDKFDGHKVVSIDATTKEVVLDNGARIGRK